MSKNINYSAILLIAMVSIVSAVIGFSISRDVSFEIQYRNIFEGCTSVVSWRDTVLSACGGTMIQAAVIFLSAFTMFTIPVSSAVIAYRWICFGWSACTCGIFSNMQLLPLAVAYAVSNIFLSYLMYKSLSFSKKSRTERTDFKALVPAALRHTYNFTVISGICLLLRVLPHIIFLKL